MKAAWLRKETGNDNYVSQSTQGQTPENLFHRAILRPMKMLFRSPIVFFLALEVSLVYGYLFLLFATFTFVFRGQYGFKSEAAGLAHLGLGVGFLLGLFGRDAASDHIAKKRAAGAAIKREDRLPSLIFGVILIPRRPALVRLDGEYRVHWMSRRSRARRSSGWASCSSSCPCSRTSSTYPPSMPPAH